MLPLSDRTPENKILSQFLNPMGISPQELLAASEIIFKDEANMLYTATPTPLRPSETTEFRGRLAHCRDLTRHKPSRFKPYTTSGTIIE
ncbi:hypothetical protein Pelo_16128 [Pelomyxa schiedti]|nr:hypothetical protein Pelo_16128 [Pelomyxa schiedti]